MNSNLVKDKIKNFLKKREDRWLIFGFYPKNHLGHACNIRYNSKMDSVEFVDGDGAIINYVPEIFIDGQNFNWDDIDLSLLNHCYLFTYNSMGINEYIPCQI